MPRSSDGEFELVLGNKQLLSLFFLVVVLFAVFFSLGYMVGKSVSPAPTMAAQQPGAAGGSATPASSFPEPVKEAPSMGAPPVEQPSAPPPTETQPARSETVAATAPAATPAASPPTATAQIEGNPGASAPLIARELHLQVAAVRVRGDAEALADALRKKGYTVVLNDQARDGWYRVLVGPFANEKDAQQVRARLEQDGYKAILKKP